MKLTVLLYLILSYLNLSYLVIQVTKYAKGEVSVHRYTPVKQKLNTEKIK